MFLPFLNLAKETAWHNKFYIPSQMESAGDADQENPVMSGDTDSAEEFSEDAEVMEGDEDDGATTDSPSGGGGGDDDGDGDSDGDDDGAGDSDDDPTPIGQVVDGNIIEGTSFGGDGGSGNPGTIRTEIQATLECFTIFLFV